MMQCSMPCANWTPLRPSFGHSPDCETPIHSRMYIPVSRQLASARPSHNRQKPTPPIETGIVSRLFRGPISLSRSANSGMGCSFPGCLADSTCIRNAEFETLLQVKTANDRSADCPSNRHLAKYDIWKVLDLCCYLTVWQSLCLSLWFRR